MNAGIAQWIEQGFSMPRMQVRVLLPVLVFVKVKTRILYLLTLSLWAPPAQGKYPGNTDPLAATEMSLQAYLELEAPLISSIIKIDQHSILQVGSPGQGESI